MSDVQLWHNNKEISLQDPNDIEGVVNVARQLKPSDMKQLINAYQAGNFQMLSTYVWSKTITALKTQLTKMGGSFIGEMLDRPDINDYSNLQQVITDFDAITLSESLGIISDKSAFRLKQSLDLLSFFNNSEFEEAEEDFDKVDAFTVLRACVQSVLGQEKVELQLDFKKFRSALEEEILTMESPHLIKLMQCPPFFKSATLKMLLSLIKTKTSAQLENGLANLNIILPAIWADLRQPEKWQVGRSYAELFTEGKTTATKGVRKALLKVKGFDFVPEDLRSTSFMRAAGEIISAHEGLNNFYNEPGAMRSLRDMGSVIPMPALSICMTAILCIKLGNPYGISWEAQSPAETVLLNIKKDKWVYYFQECLPTDERILQKFNHRGSRERWFDLIKENHEIEEIIRDVKNPLIKQLLRASQKSSVKVMEIIEQIKTSNTK